VDGDDLVDGQSVVLRHEADVRPVVPAVQDGDLDSARPRDLDLAEPRLQPQQVREDPVGGCDQRVVEDREVSVRRDHALDALGKPPLEQCRHGPHFLVDGGVDGVAVLDEDGPVAAQADAGPFKEMRHSASRACPMFLQ